MGRLVLVLILYVCQMWHFFIFFRNVFSITVMVRYRIAQVGRGEGQVRRVAMAVQDLCGTDIGTGHVDLLLFIPRTASRFIRDLLSTVSLWWAGECITCKSYAMPC